MTNERDDEMADFIKSVIDGEGTWVSKLDKINKFQMKRNGGHSIHVSAPLDVMCGQRKVDDPVAYSEELAKEVCSILQEHAEGRLEEVDVTKEAM